jgi:hypothetical protein
MRGWITVLVMLSVVFGTGGSVFAAFRDFKMDGPGTDDQWTTVANWEEGAVATVGDWARIEKDCVITNSAEAAKVSVAGFGADASLTVGGILTVGSSGIDVAYSRKTALLDVSGSLSSTGILRMGTDVTKTPTATVNFNSGSVVSLGALVMGLTPNGGTYAVNQSGGVVSLNGSLVIADEDDSLASGTYTISGGSLIATRLNMGGNGTSTCKFSVTGSDADISFSDVSFLAGQTELEFILGANGISTLDMTAGGYTAGGTATITVNAADFEGAAGTEVELIDINSGGSLSVFGNTNLIGGSLDYRADDGLYFITAALPTIPSTNLWDESFAGTTLDDSWLDRGALSTTTQSNGLFMTPDANGFARGFLATENYQDQSSGDPAATFNGKPAYNFFYHDLEITIDGLSMPTDVTDGNLLFISGVSGGPVDSNDGPRQKLPGAFLRVNSSSNKVDLGMLESTSVSRQLLNPKELNDFPDSIVLNLNANGWDVEITGTTFTDGSTSHSGVWNHITSTVFDTNAVLVVGTYNENTATTTSGSREISISGIQVNALETPPLVPNPAVLFIDAASDFVTVGASGLTAAATYSLDCSTGLILTNWTSVGLVSGVSETNWVFQATNPAAFYRMESQ